jgi:hypothetical protein
MMNIEDIAQISFRAIREEAIRCNAGTSERLGHFVRGVIQVNNDLVDKLTRDAFIKGGIHKGMGRGGFTPTNSFIYADTDSVKVEDQTKKEDTNAD